MKKLVTVLIGTGLLTIGFYMGNLVEQRESQQDIRMVDFIISSGQFDHKLNVLELLQSGQIPEASNYLLASVRIDFSALETCGQRQLECDPETVDVYLESKKKLDAFTSDHEKNNG
ncbi:MAG: hypothetical protein ACI8P9_002394 [Parasphingorhabdus sp.]|jgi:hypothetical protein